MTRVPVTFSFTPGQAAIIRNAIFKQFNLGYTVRGESLKVLARELEAAGLVTLEPVQDVRGSGYRIRATKAGREAWHNAGRTAAGRQPVCLE